MAGGQPESPGLSSRLAGWAKYLGPPVCLTVLVAALAAYDVSSVRARRWPPVSQPIAFNHEKHTKELGLGCDFCHKYYLTGRHSGLPGADVCALCHIAPLGDSPEAARLTEILKSGKPLEFKKLFRLPDYVFYSHRRHVGIAKLECTTCHDGIADTQVPPKRPLVKIRMQFCLDCHESQGVTTDCTSCHR